MVCREIKNTNKEIESIKDPHKILELKSTVSEIKNSLDVLNGRFEERKERISKHNDNSISIIHLKKNKIEINNHNLRDLRETVKCTKISNI